MGLKVVVLKKNAKLGGSTAWSLGVISASGTRLQKQSGIDDSPDDNFVDLGLYAGHLAHRDNLTLRQILVDESANDKFKLGEM